MKDQNAIHDKETKSEKWERARAIFLESVYKPDHALRGCSHNQKCYHELMEITDEVVEHVKKIPNPYQPKLKSGEYNNIPVESTDGISNMLLSGQLGDYYRQMIEEKKKGGSM